MSFFHHLNVSTEGAFRSDFNVEEWSLAHRDRLDPSCFPVRVWVKNPLEEIFNMDWIDYVQSMIPSKLVPWIPVFCRAANFNYNKNVHRDFVPMPGLPAITYGLNFTTIPGDTTEMTWYEQNDNLIEKMLANKNRLNKDELNEIGRGVIGEKNLCLIRTDVIHDVDQKKQRRWAFSLRTQDCMEPWDQIVKKYEHMFV